MHWSEHPYTNKIAKALLFAMGATNLFELPYSRLLILVRVTEFARSELSRHPWHACTVRRDGLEPGPLQAPHTSCSTFGRRLKQVRRIYPIQDWNGFLTKISWQFENSLLNIIGKQIENLGIGSVITRTPSSVWCHLASPDVEKMTQTFAQHLLQHAETNQKLGNGAAVHAQTLIVKCFATSREREGLMTQMGLPAGWRSPNCSLGRQSSGGGNGCTKTRRDRNCPSLAASRP